MKAQYNTISRYTLKKEKKAPKQDHSKKGLQTDSASIKVLDSLRIP